MTARLASSLLLAAIGLAGVGCACIGPASIVLFMFTLADTDVGARLPVITIPVR